MVGKKRTPVEILEADLAKVDAKIETLTKDLTTAKNKKKELEKQILDIHAQEIVGLVKETGSSVGEIKDFLLKKKK